MTNRSDIIIIGAGACGLMAARELAATGKTVTVLEANNRAGGRIHTLHEAGFEHPAEAGAEFVHGNLPVTLQLLRDARIPYTKVEGDMLRNTNGRWHTSDEMIDGWSDLMQQMNSLEKDMTLTQFLNLYFSEERYSALRQSALQFAQGFDAVNPDDASVLALRCEWQHEQDDMYRVNGGYVQLVNALLATCRQQQCRVAFDKAVTLVEWTTGEATITTHTNERFQASQVIITVPVSILASSESTEARIRFSPALPTVQQAAQMIGFGNVIKILLRFSHPFWNEYKDALFFFSEQPIATWWTQQPAASPMLTGWLAGGHADAFAGKDNETLLETALQSVAGMFGKPVADIKQWLTASHIVNWQQDPFAQGAYSYNKLLSEAAKQVLNQPVENTLFFAGEALYSGTSGGTVEAALVSGMTVAKKVLAV